MVQMVHASVEKMRNLLKKDTNLSVLIIMFTAVTAVLGLILQDRFFSMNNFQSMAFQISEFGFLAIAMSLSMLTGGIDLSIVANAGLSGILAATVMSGKYFPVDGMDTAVIIGMAVFAALLCATLCGLFNGILIAKLSIPPILATLGTMIFYTGIGMALTNGESVRIAVKGFSRLSSKTLLEIPYIFIMMVIAFVVISFILSKTKLGKQMYLVGENPVTLRFSGTDAEKVIIKTYALIGLLVGFSALIMIARVNSARMGFGDTYQLQAILVAVLGGFDPNGGRGKVIGVAFGMAILQFLQSAFTIFQFTPYAKKLIWGAMLLIVMVINYLINREKKARKKPKHASKLASTVNPHDDI